MTGIEQTAGEAIEAVMELREQLEFKFTELGQLLSRMKREKMFKFKGYKTFKEFVEAEFKIASAMANKLIRIHDLYLLELDQNEGRMHEIGIDKLNTITPIVKSVNFPEKEEWIRKAAELSLSELREEVKEERERLKVKTLKEIFTDQHIEKMVTYFNCSRKELDFKMALFFQKADLVITGRQIRLAQRQFDEDIENEKDNTTGMSL